MKFAIAIAFALLLIPMTALADDNSTNTSLDYTCELDPTTNKIICTIPLDIWNFILSNYSNTIINLTQQLDQERFGRLVCADILNQTNQELSTLKNNTENLSVILNSCKSSLLETQNSLGQTQEEREQAKKDGQNGQILAGGLALLFTTLFFKKDDILNRFKRTEETAPTGEFHGINPQIVDQKTRELEMKDRFEEQLREQEKRMKEETGKLKAEADRLKTEAEEKAKKIEELKKKKRRK